MAIFKKLRAVRGAVCCENTAESIEREVCFLVSAILKANKNIETDIVSIQFSITEDLTALNPAAALRKGGAACKTDFINIVRHIPLFCSAEPKVENSLPKTIRILIHYYSRRKPKPVYIHGAEVLRQDIMS